MRKVRCCSHGDKELIYCKVDLLNPYDPPVRYENIPMYIVKDDVENLHDEKLVYPAPLTSVMTYTNRTLWNSP